MKMSDIIQRLKDAYSENPAKALELLPELFKQYNNGLISVLPCKVGDTVYTVTVVNDAIYTYTEKICKITFEEENILFWNSDKEENIFTYIGNNKSFGRILFATKEAAETALNEYYAVLLSLDKAKIQAYAMKHDFGPYDNDETLWRAVHNTRIALNWIPEPEKKISRKWLKSHGLKCGIGE